MRRVRVLRVANASITALVYRAAFFLVDHDPKHASVGRCGESPSQVSCPWNMRLATSSYFGHRGFLKNPSSLWGKLLQQRGKDNRRICRRVRGQCLHLEPTTNGSDEILEPTSGKSRDPSRCSWCQLPFFVNKAHDKWAVGLRAIVGRGRGRRSCKQVGNTCRRMTDDASGHRLSIMTRRKSSDAAHSSRHFRLSAPRFFFCTDGTDAPLSIRDTPSRCFCMNSSWYGMTILFCSLVKRCTTAPRCALRLTVKREPIALDRTHLKTSVVVP